MKKLTAALIAGSMTSLTAVSFASSVALTDAFGPATNSLAVEDVRLQADQLFHQVDMNRDNVLSIDEYASQSVVLASLARFNGKIAFDEGEVPFVIELPEGAETEISATERTAIDSVARAEFYQISGTDVSLSKNEWLQSKLAEFAAADFNRDGVLAGKELKVFAMNVAHIRNTMS